MSKPFVYPVMMFVVASLFYLYEFLLRVAPSAMFSDLMRDFSLDATDFGVLASFYFISYSILQLPVGAWTDRYGPRRLLTFATVLCACSTLLFAFTDNFLWAKLARLLIGAGSAFAFICTLKILSLWFKPHLFPLLTGITLAIGSLGGVVGQVPVSMALEYVTWRELFLILGCAGLILAMFIWGFVRDGEGMTKSADNERQFLKCITVVLKRPENWLIAMYAFLMTAPTDAFGGNWGVPYLLQGRGIDRSLAATASTMTFVGMAFGSPLIGWISNKMKSRKKPMIMGGFVAIVALTTLIYAPTMTFELACALFFAHGFFGTYVLAFVMAEDINDPIYVGTTVGFVNAFSNFGSSILLYGIGKSIDFVGTGEVIDGVPVHSLLDYQWGLLPVPLFVAIAIFIILPFTKDGFAIKHSAQIKSASTPKR